MNQINQLPNLSFPDFAKAWELQKLGDFYSFKNGINADKNQYGKGFKFINVLDVLQTLPITSNSIRGLVEVNTTILERNAVVRGNLLFQRSSETRKEVGTSNVYLGDDTVTFGGFVIRGTPQKKINAVYMNYLLKSSKARKEIVTKSGGSTRYNVGQETLSSVNIFISCNEKEQQQIASFLTSVDSKISQLTEKHRLLNKYKKGVMQKLFSQQLRFKDEDGEAFPEWEYKKGNKLFKAVSNKKHNSDLPILAITQNQGAIPRELINYEVQVTDNSVAGYKVVEKGDFIISLRSFQGGIEFSNYKGICSPAYIILQPNVVIDNVFYQRYLKTHNFIQEMKKRLEGIRDGKILSYKYFSEIELPFPSFKEQQKIAQFLQSIDKKIDVVAQQVEQTKQFKKGLLQQMFV